MLNKLIPKLLYCLIIATLPLPIFASDSMADMQPFTVVMSNAITQQDGTPLNISHMQVRIGPGDGWTDLPDIKGNSNSSNSVSGKRGSRSGILRITLLNGQRYVAPFPIDASVVQLTLEPLLSLAPSAGNNTGPQYGLHTSTTVARLTPVSATGNSWNAGCVAFGFPGGGMWCSSDGNGVPYHFQSMILGVFVGDIGGTLSSNAATFDQLVHEHSFWFNGFGTLVYSRVILHDQYDSHIDAGGVALGGFQSPELVFWEKS